MALEFTDDNFEELVMKSVNEGLKKSQDMVSEAMNKVTGGMNIPGLF